MGTCTVLLVGGFLDWNVQPTNIDETSIATVTKSLIFTTIIASIMASGLGRHADRT
jgi:hypothetical protein